MKCKDKNPLREALEREEVIDGDAFDMILMEEREERVIGYLKKISNDLESIKKVMDIKQKYYDDSGNTYE
ncbi:hypothetical protein MKC72_09170 [[Clostridium] innocuum]|nr:hypothetical protein [[Clostridium] innocuum]